MFEQSDGKVNKTEAKVFNIALNKNSKIDDLKGIVADLVGIEKEKLIVTNHNGRSGTIETRFKGTQSCQDVDQSRDETIIYELRHPPEKENLGDYRLVEVNFMKMVKYGKYHSGETLRRVFPRLELLKQSMTILDIKKFIF